MSESLGVDFHSASIDETWPMSSSHAVIAGADTTPVESGSSRSNWRKTKRGPRQAAMLADATPGECPACDKLEIGVGIWKATCADKACVSAWKVAGILDARELKGTRKGKPNTKPHDAACRERYGRSQESKSDAALPEFVRAQIRRWRMRPFFAKYYKGFAEYYAEKHEDLGWNQAYSNDDSAPDHDARGDGSWG